MDSAAQENISDIQTNPPVIPEMPEKKSNANLLIILLFILILILFSVVGLLGYQNYKLQRKLTSITANTTTLPSLSPTSDLTADWKTYQHTSCGDYPSEMPFSVKIPADWVETIEGGGGKAYTNYVYKKDDVSVTITCGDGFGGGGCGSLYPQIQNKININGDDISACMEQNQSEKIITLRLAYLSFSDTMPGFSFEASAPDTADNKNLINQILSTFKYSGDQGTTISSQRAASIVNNLPEVKSFIATAKNGVVIVDEMDSTDKYFVIQVYEQFPDHNATFNWYHVDKITGEATKQI